MSEDINFTQAAAQKVWELMKDEGNLNLKLRVFVTGGGCSGFKYGFTFDEEINDDDQVVTRGIKDAEVNVDVKLLVDSLSYTYLIGAEIDYEEDINGEQFVIRNPNANTTCGCGSSFSAD